MILFKWKYWIEILKVWGQVPNIQSKTKITWNVPEINSINAIIRSSTWRHLAFFRPSSSIEYLPVNAIAVAIASMMNMMAINGTLTMARLRHIISQSARKKIYIYIYTHKYINILKHNFPKGVRVIIVLFSSIYQNFIIH